MTAQAIGGVPLDLSNNTTINGTVVTANVTAEDFLAAKVGISTTLAFFVGLIQVDSTRLKYKMISSMFIYCLAHTLILSTWFHNCLFN